MGLIRFFRRETCGEDVSASPLERQVAFWDYNHGDGTVKGKLVCVQAVQGSME